MAALPGVYLGAAGYLGLPHPAIPPAGRESPELIVACLYAIRLKASRSFGTLGWLGAGPGMPL